MKVLNLHLLAVGLLAFISSPNARSQTNTPLANLTLEQAIEIAERYHPNLSEATALVAAAESRVQQAGRYPNPEAIVRMESAPFSGRTTRDAEYLGGLGFTIPLGNRRSRAVNVEEGNHARLVFEVEARRLALRQRVHGAFATALYQEEAGRIRNDLLTAAQQAVNVTQARVDAGDAIPTDVARVELELVNARAERQRSDVLRNQALGALALVIGLRADQVQTVEGSLTSTFEVPALEELAFQLGHHPALAAAEADLSSKVAGIAWAKATRIPDLKAELLYHRIESEQRDAFDVGFSLPLPIFDRGRGRLVEAESQHNAAEARLRSTRNQLQASLRDAHGRLRLALADVRTLEDEILPRMESVRKITEARYAAGDMNLSEALLVRRDHAAARLRHLEALRDAMLAWSELRPFIRQQTLSSVEK
jgi:cobalt-zinc-cadmium efflux system outer membrane protein